MKRGGTMANEQNLINLAKRTQRERQEIARMGQKASVKVQNEKRTMRKTLEMMLEETSKKGIPYKDLVTLGLITGAVKGNAQNYKTIVEMVGELQPSNEEKPMLKIEIIDNENKIKEE